MFEVNILSIDAPHPQKYDRFARKIRLILDLVISLVLLAEETNFYGLVHFCGQRPLPLYTTYTVYKGVSYYADGWMSDAWLSKVSTDLETMRCRVCIGM